MNIIMLYIIIYTELQSKSDYTEKLANWRDESCVMMEFLLRLSTELVRCEFSSGRCGDILLKAMAQFFATMTSLTGDLIDVHNKNKVDFSSKRYNC